MKLASNIELIMASSMSSGMSAAQAILNQSVLWVVPPNRWLAIAQTVNCRNESRRESFLNSLGAAMISMSPRQWHVLHVSEKDILRNKFFFAFFLGPKWKHFKFKKHNCRTFVNFCDKNGQMARFIHSTAKPSVRCAAKSIAFGAPEQSKPCFLIRIYRYFLIWCSDMNRNRYE